MRRPSAPVVEPSDTVVPSPRTRISRQPIRCANDESSKLTVTPRSRPEIGAVYSQTVRIVDSPAAPGGIEIPAANATSVSAFPSTVRCSEPARRWQATRRSASISSSLTEPSPSASIRWRSVKVGSSASSMTTSMLIALDETRRPA